MGDMADYYNDYCDLIHDEPDVICRYCGREELHWEYEKRWVLFDMQTMQPHKCKSVNADDLRKLQP